MRTRLALLAAAALAAIAVAAAAAAPPLAEGVTFKPVAKSGVAGTGTVTQNGIGTGVVVRLSGLEPGSTARVLLRAGRYPRLSASFAKAVNVKADAQGRARGSSAIRFRDEPVAFQLVADGRHVLTVVAGGRVVAVAEIPGLD
jgi:lipoprotein-anchoring transpeptidase ErfK/SrfK